VRITLNRRDSSTIEFGFSHLLTKFSGKTLRPLWIKYDRDIGVAPDHVLNFMIAIILSEHLAWSSHLYDKVIFSELTESEISAIQRHINVNHKTNPYGFVTKNGKPMTVVCNKIVQDQGMDKKRAVLAGNGMGKDGLTCVSLASEISENVIAFTIGNQYKTEALWQERRAAMSKVYAILSIPNCQIMTNYMSSFGYKIIPWWLFAVPLAYAYGASTILSGLEMPFSKTNNDNLLPRPNCSLFHLGCVSSGLLDIDFSSVTHALSTLGVQRLLLDRYPKIASFQRSCMTGMPWCYACGTCHNVYTLIKAVGHNPGIVGINKRPRNRDVLNPLISDTHQYAMELVDGKSVPEWVYKANESILKLLWRGEDIGSILLDTGFDFYSGNTAPDNNGYGCYVDKWKKWLNQDDFPPVK